MFWLIAFLPFTPNSCRQPRRSNYISFSVNLRVWLRGNMRKAHARHVAQAYVRTCTRSCICMPYTGKTHTHTHNHRVGKCQLCLLSPEVQCRMRLHFYSEHCALSPSVILVMCVCERESLREKEGGSDEICCIRGCSGV